MLCKVHQRSNSVKVKGWHFLEWKIIASNLALQKMCWNFVISVNYSALRTTLSQWNGLQIGQVPTSSNYKKVSKCKLDAILFHDFEASFFFFKAILNQGSHILKLFRYNAVSIQIIQKGRGGQLACLLFQWSEVERCWSLQFLFSAIIGNALNINK